MASVSVGLVLRVPLALAGTDEVGTLVPDNTNLPGGSRFPSVELLSYPGAEPDALGYAAFPAAVQLADVDGDGDQDIISAWWPTMGAFCVVWENRGNEFVPLWSDRDGAAISFGMQLAAGDIDADGDVDFVVNYATTGIVAYVNDGTGHFTRAARANEVGDFWMELRLCDLDGDHYPDLVGIRQNTNQNDNNGGAVVVLRNNHDSTFGVRAVSGRGGANLLLAVDEPGTPTTVQCADIDQDGFVDIISNSYDGYKLLTWHGHGSLTFDSAPNVASIDVKFGGLSVADYDRDGDLDIASSIPAESGFVVYPNSDGQFGSPNRFASGNLASFGGFADFNGDCYPDYYTTSVDECYVSISLNDTHGGFLPPARYSVGARVRIGDVGDVDGDGDLDLVLATMVEYATPITVPGQIAIMRNRGDGKFWAPAAIDGPNDPATIAVADFNNDGQKDLVLVRTFYMSSSTTGDYVPTQTTASIEGGNSSLMGMTAIATPDLDNDAQPDLIVDGSVYFSNHHGDFTAGWSDPLQYPRYNMAVGNLDNDTRLDWVVSTVDLGIWAYFGADNGTFEGPISFEFTGPQSSAMVALADMNADGLDDIVAAVYIETNPGVLVALNQGDGRSYDATLYASPAPAFGLAVADFNGDKTLDVAVTTCDAPIKVPGKIAVFLGDGDGALAKPKTFGSVTCPFLLMSGDIDGDGDIDLAASTTSPHDYLVEVLPNDGTGAFPGYQVLVAGHTPNGIVLSDLDSDGDLDIVTANAAAYTATIFRNEVLSEDPRANSAPRCGVPSAGGTSGSGGSTGTTSSVPTSGGISNSSGGTAPSVGGGQSNIGGTQATSGSHNSRANTGGMQAGGAPSGGASGASTDNLETGGSAPNATFTGGVSSSSQASALGGSGATFIATSGGLSSSVHPDTWGGNGSTLLSTGGTSAGGPTDSRSTFAQTSATPVNTVAGTTTLATGGSIGMGTTMPNSAQSSDSGCTCRLQRRSQPPFMPVLDLLGLALIAVRRRVA